jgi:hypothetical protein
MFFGRAGVAFKQTTDAKQLLRFRKVLKIKIRGKKCTYKKPYDRATIGQNGN